MNSFVGGSRSLMFAQSAFVALFVSLQSVEMLDLENLHNSVNICSICYTLLNRRAANKTEEERERVEKAERRKSTRLWRSSSRSTEKKGRSHPTDKQHNSSNEWQGFQVTTQSPDDDDDVGRGLGCERS